MKLKSLGTNTILEINESELEAQETLIESANYKDMYARYEDRWGEIAYKDLRAMDITRHPSKIEKSARAILKKRDRITWFMRQYVLAWMCDIYKIAYARKREEIGVPLLEDINEYVERYNKKTNGAKLVIRNDTPRIYWKDENSVMGTSITSLEAFEHFLSLPIPEITNRVWRWETYGELIHDFGELEDKWKETRRRMVDLAPDQEILIDFGDYAWVDLGKAASEEEANAMGHCGNQPQANNPDHVIHSLRKRVMQGGEQIGWEPALTFIYHKSRKGYGEMKGRANAKPAERYHKYIIPLLERPETEELMGGGYLADSNFAISDLSKPDALRLLKDKPNLATYDEMYELNMTKELLNRLEENDEATMGNLAKYGFQDHPLFRKAMEEVEFRLYGYGQKDPTVYPKNISEITIEIDSGLTRYEFLDHMVNTPSGKGSFSEWIGDVYIDSYTPNDYLEDMFKEGHILKQEQIKHIENRFSTEVHPDLDNLSDILEWLETEDFETYDEIMMYIRDIDRSYDEQAGLKAIEARVQEYEEWVVTEGDRGEQVATAFVRFSDEKHGNVSLFIDKEGFIASIVDLTEQYEDSIDKEIFDIHSVNFHDLVGRNGDLNEDRYRDYPTENDGEEIFALLKNYVKPGYIPAPDNIT